MVRQARSQEPIFYAALAKEIGMPNARNLNYVLGVVGNSIKQLEKQSNKKIPLINFLVINQSEGMPGSGVEEFLDQANFNTLNKNQRRRIVDKILTDVYLFRDWHWVLAELHLKPLVSNYNNTLKTSFYGKGGESQEHKNFKNFIAHHPNLFGLPSKLIGNTEHKLPSADAIDVVFEYKELCIGIEIKSFISDQADIQRGLFQCVKYKALLEAEQIVNDQLPNSRVILALENELPKQLIGIKNQLGIEVYEHHSNKRVK